MDKPLTSVTDGQCDIRPTVAFPAVGVTALWPVPISTVW